MLSQTTRCWLADNEFDPENLERPALHDDTAIVLASRQGEVGVVRELIDAGVHINHRNMDGTNALWASVVANSFAIAQMLLDNGADIDNQNDNGATVLMYAASNAKPDWVTFLLSKGASTKLRTLDDFSALDLANTVEILHQLRKAG